MTKQYFSTLLKRVGVSSLIGMAIMLLMLACPAPVGGGGDDDGPSGTPPKPPTLGSVAPLDNGGIVIRFTESSDLYFKHTLITAKSITDGGHTVTATVPRGFGSFVPLYGLKAHYAYDISIQAVSRDGTPSTATETQPVTVQLTPEAKEARKGNFFSFTKSDGRTPEDNPAIIEASINGLLGIKPKLDKNTSSTYTKVTLTDIPSWAGIVQIDVLAVDANVDIFEGEYQIEDASKDSKKSVLKKVEEPKSGQDVELKNLKVAKSGSHQGKVNVFYRLHDINKVVSNWISTGDAVKPAKLSVEIKALKVTGGNQSITAITWKPVAGYKTLIQIVNTDVGAKIAEHTFAAGVKTAAAVIQVGQPFAVLKGNLFGTGTYKIIAKAVKGGISTKGTSKTLTLTDSIGPSGTYNGIEPILLYIKKVGGRILEVRVNAPPFEQDYAKTVIQVLVKEGSSDATVYKSITLHKGELYKTFEGSKDGVYTATALFYDIVGNASKVAAGKTYTVASKAPRASAKLASTDKKPTKVAVVIKPSPTATKSPIVDGRVMVIWELTDATKPKSNQVKEWTVTPLQYVAAGTGDATRLRAKTVKGSTLTPVMVTFTKLPLDKQYEFEVEGKDKWDLDIAAVKSNKVKLGARIPANIPQNAGATVKRPNDRNITGTLLFKKANSLDMGKNATHIELTLKKDGTIVKGYNKKLYNADADLKPLAPSSQYTAELRAHSSATGKFSKVKTVGSFIVGDGTLAATTGITEVQTTPTAQGTSFSVAVSTIPTTGASATSFGTHYDGSALDDATFELYYARHDVTAGGVTVDGLTVASDIVKVVNATSNKENAGKIDIANKAGLSKIDVTGLTKGATYRYFIRTVNKIVNVRHVDGEPEDIQLTLESPPQILTPVVTAVANKNQLKVRVPATTDFGNAKADGAELDAGTVEYVFYYARDGFSKDGGGTIGADSSADDIKKKLNYDAANDVNRGKVALTTGNGNGVGATAAADKLVSHLSASTKYYWFVQVQEKAAYYSGTNSDVKSVTTQGARAGVGAPPTIKAEATLISGEAKITLTIPVGFDYGRKADGNKLARNGVKYRLYYSQRPNSTATQTATDTGAVNLQALASNPKTDKANGGIALTGDGPWTVTGLTPNAKYWFALRIVHPASTVGATPKANDGVEFARDTAAVFATTLAEVEEATAPSKPENLGTSAGGDGSGELSFYLDPLTSRGTKAGNIAVAQDQLKYWIFYVRVGYDPDGAGAAVAITNTITAINLIAIVGGDTVPITTKAANADKGKQEVAGNAFVDGDTPLVVLTGFKKGATYRYTIMVVHPDGPNSDLADVATSSVVK